MRRVVLLACLLLGAAAAGCSTSSGTQPAQAAPTGAQIRTFLASHASALREHDRADFLAGIDAAGNAAAFGRRQRSAYADLALLPLSTWSYSLADRAGDRPAEQAATRRYSAGAAIVHVVLHYALRGIDPRPSDKDLYWTFLRAGGRVVLAGDDDLAGDGGQSWRGPWDFGPLQVTTRLGVLLLDHPGTGAAANGIAGAVQSAVPAVTGVWGRDWSQRVAVVVPASSAELAAYAAQADVADPGAGLAAFAVSDAPDPVTATVTGQRLVVNLSVARRLSTTGVAILVRHEITHLAAAVSTTDLSPRWLVEGFADYVGNLGSGQPVAVAAGELAARVRRGDVPARLPTEADFADARSAAAGYEGSWLACRLLATLAGQRGLVRIYRLAGTAAGGLPAALDTVLHLTLAAFTGRWRTYVVAQLRG